MGRGPISFVKHIHIIPDSKDFDITPIQMAIGIANKISIRNVDLHTMNNRILEIPGIEKSAIRRLPNGDLIIKTKKYIR